jgi:sigma-B regulation protein RsbU (phosphoserine phosphatase)
VFFAYTGGMSEAMNEEDEEWGEERMLEVAKSLVRTPGCDRSAESMVKCLFREADRFTAGEQQHDDMTVVVCAIR